MNVRAQTAIEFFMIVGMVLYFFSLFLGAVQNSNQEKSKILTNQALEEIVKTLKGEINLAISSKEGYSRNFSIPNKVLNSKPYSILINDNLIYAITDDEKNSYSEQIVRINGQPVKGINTIRKINGIVYLNQ